jgi:hypothetical protein
MHCFPLSCQISFPCPADLHARRPLAGGHGYRATGRSYSVEAAARLLNPKTAVKHIRLLFVRSATTAYLCDRFAVFIEQRVNL